MIIIIAVVAYSGIRHNVCYEIDNYVKKHSLITVTSKGIKTIVKLTKQLLYRRVQCYWMQYSKIYDCHPVNVIIYNYYTLYMLCKIIIL